VQKDLLTLSTQKRKWEIRFMADKGINKKATIPTVCTAKDFFALSADIKGPRGQKKT